MRLLYTLSIHLYYAGICVASLWNKKARLWLQGRKSVFVTLEANVRKGDRWIWMHCSSAGEFEQGKPVAEALKTKYPHHKLLITFFSPSGYAVAGVYKQADLVCYLPLDTRKNAERFVRTVKPELGIFVKYEFWYHHLSVAAFHHIPLLLVSAVFRPKQVFFKPYGSFFRNMLFFFRHIFVQNEASLELLRNFGFTACTVGGDTRFDRVIKLVEDPVRLPIIENFTAGRKTLVAGSTWPDDDAALSALLTENRELRCIVAPHDVDKSRIQSLRQQIPGAVLYSSLSNATNQDQQPNLSDVQTIIIDSVGLLSRLYAYGTLTYVGGGFTSDGVHNVLEAAVWGKPVIFGPNYRKYREASALIATGGGFSVADAAQLKGLAAELLVNGQQLQAAGERARNYVAANAGATELTLSFIQEKRLLTN